MASSRRGSGTGRRRGTPRGDTSRLVIDAADLKDSPNDESPREKVQRKKRQWLATTITSVALLVLWTTLGAHVHRRIQAKLLSFAPQTDQQTPRQTVSQLDQAGLLDPLELGHEGARIAAGLRASGSPPGRSADAQPPKPGTAAREADPGSLRGQARRIEEGLPALTQALTSVLEALPVANDPPRQPTDYAGHVARASELADSAAAIRRPVFDTLRRIRREAIRQPGRWKSFLDDWRPLEEEVTAFDSRLAVLEDACRSLQKWAEQARAERDFAEAREAFEQGDDDRGADILTRLAQRPARTTPGERAKFLMVDMRTVSALYFLTVLGAVAAAGSGYRLRCWMQRGHRLEQEE